MSIKKPRPALLTSFDSQAFAGALWQWSTPYGMSNTTIVPLDNGELYPDLIAFLNGYGTRSGYDLGSILDDNKGSLSSLTCGIDENDKFFLRTNVENFGFSIQIYNTGDHREDFGFTGHEQTTQDGSAYRLTATNAWKRGLFSVDSSQYMSGNDKKGLVVTTWTNEYTVSNGYHDGGNPTGQRLYFGASDMPAATFASLTSNHVVKDSDDQWFRVSGGYDYTAYPGLNYYLLLMVPIGHTNYSTSQLFWNDGTQFDCLPDVEVRKQSLITWIRKRGAMSDLDDKYSGKCLEDFEHEAGNEGATWLVQPDGRVAAHGQYSHIVTNGLFYQVTDNGKALLKELGFTEHAAENLTHYIGANGDIPTAVGEFPASSVLTSDTGYVELRRETTFRDDLSIMADGTVISSGLEPLRGWALTIRISGPALGFDKDREKLVREWFSRFEGGVTFYPTFGDALREEGGIDPRRHRALEDLSLTAFKFTRFYTAEAELSPAHHGKRVGGRLILRRDPQDSQDRLEMYETALELFQDITIKFLDDS